MGEEGPSPLLALKNVEGNGHPHVPKLTLSRLQESESMASHGPPANMGERCRVGRRPQLGQRKGRAGYFGPLHLNYVLEYPLSQ
jgi:hypothetical protein